MNDPNGVAWRDGWCHVFYQHNPGADTWADMHWGHARSRDLVHWEHRPIALQPQRDAGEGHCYSGCLARTADGAARILYTSVPASPTDPVTQVMATPADEHWDRWTQHVAAPFLALASHDGPAFDRDWRDPFVFKHEGRTFLILGATLGDEAVVPLYENPDGTLENWTYRGLLLRAPRTRTHFFECPGIVRCGDKWALIVCPCREVEWHVGTLDLDRGTFQVERSGRYDDSDHYYASHPAIAPDGRVLVFGWAQKFPAGRGWNGCLGAPRRVWLDDGGALCSEPVAELQALRGDVVELSAAELGAAPLALPLPDSALGEGDLELALPPDGGARLEIAGVTVVLSASGVAFDGRPRTPLDATGTVRVRWLLDRSLLELFVGGRAAYTRVVAFPVATPARLSAAGGGAHLRGGRLWTLRASPAQVLEPAGGREKPLPA